MQPVLVRPLPLFGSDWLTAPTAVTKCASSATISLQEFKMLRHISRDANVVQCQGACLKDGRWLLVMELMEVRVGRAESGLGPHRPDASR